MTRISSRQSMRVLARVSVVVAAILTGCGSKNVTTQAESKAATCDLAAQTPWIEHWFDAWELTSREILKLPDAPAPTFVFFDSACVYTTSQVSALGAPVVKNGPKLLGKKLEWRATAHDGEITTPKGETREVALMSYTDADKKGGPFFVMAAPSYWEQTIKRGDPYGFTGVFLHEFTHTRQFKGIADIIGPIDKAWAFDFELDDDAVQNRFGADSVYVKAYLEELDLLYKAADAPTDGEARAIAQQALEMIHARHTRYFTGENAVFSTLDNVWLSMEGAAQWSAYAWLSHPKGAGMSRADAVAKMLGRRRWWAQDEGLVLFLVIDRLMPEWPTLVFGEKSMGGIDLLERAVK
jgi:hypothetical protein